MEATWESGDPAIGSSGEVKNFGGWLSALGVRPGSLLGCLYKIPKRLLAERPQAIAERLFYLTL
jgi:hypothetical protein